MPLAETLKHATSDAHRHAESRELQRGLLRGSLEEGVLATYLTQLYHLHVGLENAFDARPDVGAAIGWSDEFRHSRRLAADLAAIGVRADERPALEETRRTLDEIERDLAANPLSLLGAFYVLEGSMNGNRFIVRALRASALGSRCPFTYFDPYGEAQPARWAAFKVALDGVELGEADRGAIVDAALGMFAAIGSISDASAVLEDAAPVA